MKVGAIDAVFKAAIDKCNKQQELLEMAKDVLEAVIIEHGAGEPRADKMRNIASHYLSRINQEMEEK